MMMKRSWIAILTLLTQLVDQHAQQTIEYLKENKILFQKLGKKRLILTDQERRSWPRRRGVLVKRSSDR